jgi:hypothetical protein
VLFQVEDLGAETPTEPSENHIVVRFVTHGGGSNSAWGGTEDIDAHEDCEMPDRPFRIGKSGPACHGSRDCFPRLGTRERRQG